MIESFVFEGKGILNMEDDRVEIKGNQLTEYEDGRKSCAWHMLIPAFSFLTKVNRKMFIVKVEMLKDIVCS